MPPAWRRTCGGRSRPSTAGRRAGPSRRPRAGSRGSPRPTGISWTCGSRARREARRLLLGLAAAAARVLLEREVGAVDHRGRVEASAVRLRLEGGGAPPPRVDFVFEGAPAE